MIPGADPVHKVTIIPRGRALGVTTYLPNDEKHTYSKEYLEAMIAYALGGRAAEKIIFNQYTTGAGNDIEKATKIARKMVCEWGMSERLGPLAYGQKEEEIFLGREITKHTDFSEKTAEAIDEEIQSIIMKGMEKAENILQENIDILHKLAHELLVREILDAEEIKKIMNGEELPPVQKEELPDHVKELLEKRKKESEVSSKEISEENSDSDSEEKTSENLDTEKDDQQ